MSQRCMPEARGVEGLWAQLPGKCFSAIDRLYSPVNGSQITLLAAPAGYGKSVAMWRWSKTAKAQGRAVFRLEGRGDGAEASALRTALTRTARQVFEPCVIKASGARTPDSPPSPVSLAPIVFIDDAHLLPEDALDLLSRCLNDANLETTVVLASRGAIDLKLGRRRSLGGFVELGTEDLRMRHTEIGALATAVLKAPLKPDELRCLVERTQGWAAGVTLSLELCRKEGGWIEPSGLNYALAEYFEQEVLTPQPEAMRDFLADISILDVVTASSAIAVSENADGGLLLQAAHAAGLFMEPQDSTRTQYRFHPMFREWLLGQLAQRSASRVTRLHMRAGCYFAQSKQPLAAISHAASSHDPRFLADQLDQLAEALTYSGHLYRVVDSAASLPWEITATKPMLLLALAWRRIRGLAFSSARRLIDAAAARIEAMRASGEFDDHHASRLKDLVRHREIMLSAARDEMAVVEQEAERLLSQLGDENLYLSCTLLAQLMSARRELYHFDDTLKLEAEVRKALRWPGTEFASIALKASVAPTLIALGKTALARQFLEEALEFAQSKWVEAPGMDALPAMPLAELNYECDELDIAQALIDRHLASVREWGFVDQLTSGYLVRARLAAARKDIERALDGLAEAHLVAIECGLSRLRSSVVGEQIRILCKSGRLQEARLAFRQGDLDSEQEHIPTTAATRCDETVAIAWLRLEMHGDELASAKKIATLWRDFVRKRGALRSTVTFELLLCQFSRLQGYQLEARRSLHAALQLAAPAGWIRPFIDEGDIVTTLLTEAYGSAPIADTPADQHALRLLSAIQGSKSLLGPNDVPVLTAPLIEREVELLQMVASGLGNRDIGNRMGMTEGTVKWHLQQVYDKLGVRRRTQAVLVARKLSLLP